MKDVMILTGAGQIGMAIARRMGHGMKIVVGDKSLKNAEAITKIMNEAGFDAEPFEMDLSSRKDIKAIIAKTQEYGEIKMLVNAAGVSPSQAPIEVILKVDLYDVSPKYFAPTAQNEVDFLVQSGAKVIPIEVKSGESINSPSLRDYIKKYEPTSAVRFSKLGLKKDGISLIFLFIWQVD